MVIGLTTSDVHGDHSRNIFRAFAEAQEMGAKRIGLFSMKTRDLVNFVDVAILVPSENTALIQEAHLAIIHMLCGEIEKSLVNKKPRLGEFLGCALALRISVAVLFLVQIPINGFFLNLPSKPVFALNPNSFLAKVASTILLG